MTLISTLFGRPALNSDMPAGAPGTAATGCQYSTNASVFSSSSPARHHRYPLSYQSHDLDSSPHPLFQTRPPHLMAAPPPSTHLLPPHPPPSTSTHPPPPPPPSYVPFSFHCGRFGSADVVAMATGFFPPVNDCGVVGRGSLSTATTTTVSGPNLR